MKNTGLIFCLLFSFLMQAQDGIQFQTSGFQDLLAKAKKENKLVFIDAMASWCGPCKLMDKNVFSQKSVGNYYNSTFINGKFDMEKGEGREIAQKYGVNSYPTYLFLNGDGQLISRNYGYLAESTFLEVGKEAHAALANIGSMRERFDKGEKDPEFLINIIKLYATSDYDFAKKASERYFQHKKSAEFTKDEVHYLLFCVKSVDDPNYAVFQKNRQALSQHFPEQTFVEFDNHLKLQKLTQNAIDPQTKTVKEAFFLKEAEALVGPEIAKRTLNLLKLNHYEQTDNYPAYEKTALEYYASGENFDQNELLKAAWVFADKATDKKALKTAEMWAEKSVQQRETSENTYILAKLYQRSGKLPEARIYAEASANLAKAAKADAIAAEKLLEELK